MNPLFANLQAYPFERLNALLAGAESNPALPMIPLSLGEPKHAAAEFLLDQYANRESLTAALGTYPVTKGVPELRSAIVGFVSRRFGLQGVNPDTEVRSTARGKRCSRLHRWYWTRGSVRSR